MKQHCFLISIIFYFSLFIYNSVSAQSVNEIKNDKNYVWGEGSGSTSNAAEREAMAQMSRSISAVISDKREDINSNTESYQSSVLKCLTFIRLQNIQNIILSEEPNAKVFCYMHRSEVQRIFDAREQRIKDMVKAGKVCESRLQIDDALRNYYWALLLSYFNPNPITIDFGETEGQSVSLLETKINSMLKLLRGEIIDGNIEGSNAIARVFFTYNGKTVSSLQFKYNDGQSIVGPVLVKDGIGEVDMVSIPSSKKINITYEYKFRNEVKPMDGDLVGTYSVGGLPQFQASDVLQFNLKKTEIKPVKNKNTSGTSAVELAAQPTKEKTPITFSMVSDFAAYEKAMNTVEEAIRTHNPKLAYNDFTPKGYEMFDTLLSKTGYVTLVGNSEHQFVKADDQILGRHTRIKIKFRNGKSFVENVVYRFNSDAKIESIAFALTKQAENDIMDAAASWPEISRWAILGFMEDYQTAFALKRIDYIQELFSDHAVIVTGTVLKKKDADIHSSDMQKMVDLKTKGKGVMYSRYSKSEYINKLKSIFDSREFVHLAFEDNRSVQISLPSVYSAGAAFGIEIKQRYTSPVYSDEGYLTLLFDTTTEPKTIHARLWQPDKIEGISLGEFINLFIEKK